MSGYKTESGSDNENEIIKKPKKRAPKKKRETTKSWGDLIANMSNEKKSSTKNQQEQKPFQFSFSEPAPFVLPKGQLDEKNSEDFFTSFKITEECEQTIKKDEHKKKELGKEPSKELSKELGKEHMLKGAVNFFHQKNENEKLGQELAGELSKKFIQENKKEVIEPTEKQPIDKEVIQENKKEVMEPTEKQLIDKEVIQEAKKEVMKPTEKEPIRKVIQEAKKEFIEDFMPTKAQLLYFAEIIESGNLTNGITRFSHSLSKEKYCELYHALKLVANNTKPKKKFFFFLNPDLISGIFLVSGSIIYVAFLLAELKLHSFI